MLLAGTLVHARAEDSIDTQIDEIQKAPAEQRVQLMNQLKMKLANMNEEDQSKAMNQMRERLQTRVQKRSSNTTQEAQKHMNQMQQMNQIQHQNMVQTQNLNMSGGAMQGGKR